MEEIKYMEKPDWVSWDDVHQCLYNAHQVNRMHGFNMVSQDMSGADLEKKMGKNGHCFVALDERKLVGVSTVRFFKSRRWWAWGKTVAYFGLEGIIKEYQGTDVYFGLYEMRNAAIKKSGVRIIQSNTAEGNTLILRRVQKVGGKFVQYSATGKGADHYSIIMVRWLDGCPWPDWFVNFMFNISKIVVRAIWKPGKKFRWTK